MTNSEKPSKSADNEKDKEKRPTNNDRDDAVTTTTTTTVVTPPSRRRAEQVRAASGGSKKRKNSQVKGAGSSSGSKSAKQKKKSGELDAPKGEPRCPICGSRFGSWKGYFGHLRVHKHRTWEGAFPPPPWEVPKEDEQFQNYVASELSRIGHETLLKMRQEESGSSSSNINVGLDLNAEPEGDDPPKAEFDLNLPPRENDDSDP